MSEIQKVGVVGLGMMGHGIAMVTAQAGIQVVARDVDDAAVQRGVARIAQHLDRSVERGKTTQEERDAVLERVTGTTQDDALADCDLVIEAVVEEVAGKLKVWRALDGVVKPDAIFATNTSSLSVIEQAAATQRPDRFIGLHFFSPVPQMPLVEVVRAVTSADASVDLGRRYVEAIGKNPTITEDRAGFVVNRLLVPYLLDAVRAYEEGLAPVEQLDAAMRGGAGHPMGPLRLIDLVGLDVLGNVAEVMYDEYRERRFAPPPLLRKMLAAGWHGQKTKRGFYDYSGAEPVPNPDLTRTGV